MTERPQGFRSLAVALESEVEGRGVEVAPAKIVAAPDALLESAAAALGVPPDAALAHLLRLPTATALGWLADELTAEALGPARDGREVPLTDPLAGS